jgi:integrase
MLMDELFDRFREECMDDLRDRTRRDYERMFVKLRQEFGTREARDIRPRDIVKFLSVKTGRVHRNRLVMLLSMVFSKAIGKWCIDDELRNPCTGVERWTTKPRKRYVSDEEFAAFRATCCSVVQIAMDLALLTGQRQGDIVGLKWSQVRMDGPRKEWFIEIRQGKTGKHLGIGISPAIQAVLERARCLPPSVPCEYVLRTNASKKRGERFTTDGFRALWQRHMRDWVRRGNENFHFHDIRAKSISDNKSLENAYLLAGHIDIKMTRRVYDRNIRMVEPLR